MHAVAYIFRRKKGLTLDQFLERYQSHREVMLKYSRGLVSYTQHPVREKHPIGDTYTTNDGELYDAISVYVYEKPEDAHFSNCVPEIENDSMQFIDFDTMISLPINRFSIL